MDTKADTLARKTYSLAATPTVILMEPSGRQVDRTLGFLRTGEFIETIEGYRKGVGTLDALLAEEPSRMSDAAFAFRLGERLFAHNRLAEADERFARVVEVDPANASGDADDALIERGTIARKAKDWAKAIGHCRDLIARWPQSDLADDALVYVGWYSANAGQTKEAVSAYKEYLDRWPEGEDAEFVKGELKELEEASTN